MRDALYVSDAVWIPANELTWTAVRSSGPGGQNVNKVASKIELRFDLVATAALSPAVKGRLRVLAGNRIDQEGRLRIVSQKTRDQSRNLEDARQRLAALVRSALMAPKPRRATKPTRSSQRRRVENKQHDARKKALRRRVERDE